MDTAAAENYHSFLQNRELPCFPLFYEATLRFV